MRTLQVEPVAVVATSPTMTEGGPAESRGAEVSAVVKGTFSGKSRATLDSVLRLRSIILGVGRLAQGESASLTPRRSQVQILYRPHDMSALG